MKQIIRHAVRLLIALGAALLALGLVPKAWTALAAAGLHLPRISPILGLLGALAARAWLGWLTLLGIPLLVLAFFKGRFFCWHVCPMGFLSETAGRLNPWGKGLVKRVPPINKVVALVIAVTAACGYPLLIWLDPLCIFNGFFAVWREPFTWAAATTGIGFVAVLALSLVAPHRPDIPGLRPGDGHGFHLGPEKGLPGLSAKAVRLRGPDGFRQVCKLIGQRIFIPGEEQCPEVAF